MQCLSFQAEITYAQKADLRRAFELDIGLFPSALQHRRHQSKTEAY